MEVAREREVEEERLHREAEMCAVDCNYEYNHS